MAAGSLCSASGDGAVAECLGRGLYLPPMHEQLRVVAGYLNAQLHAGGDLRGLDSLVVRLLLVGQDATVEQLVGCLQRLNSADADVRQVMGVAKELTGALGPLWHTD